MHPILQTCSLFETVHIAEIYVLINMNIAYTNKFAQSNTSPSSMFPEVLIYLFICEQMHLLSLDYW